MMPNQYEQFSGTFLCHLDDIPDPGGREFMIGETPTPIEIFVVRKGSQAWGYINSCPHTGGPLNWTPGNFLDRSKTIIQCATHGAQFNISDGQCIHGPCAGSLLTAVKVDVVDQQILIAGPDDS